VMTRSYQPWNSSSDQSYTSSSPWPVKSAGTVLPVYASVTVTLALFSVRLAICSSNEPLPPNPCVALTPSRAAEPSLLPLN
jgi:hypothetical protein